MEETGSSDRSSAQAQDEGPAATQRQKQKGQATKVAKIIWADAFDEREENDAETCSILTTLQEWKTQTKDAQAPADPKPE